MPFNNLDNLTTKTIAKAVLEQDMELLVNKAPISEYQMLLSQDNALEKLYSIVIKDAGLSAVFIKIANSGFFNLRKQYFGLAASHYQTWSSAGHQYHYNHHSKAIIQQRPRIHG
ncbi:hypothetical protein [Shewanella baltica]|uniref:hypothetical protein n=1 Tax=Shewanella baltica TaxID=62322 RepID=UPI0002112CC7|nr:hypothetical protein [Shewanella baltica]AEH16198.1 hypothetical protein Sbal117_4560 [Shewanella baltica OS117]